MLSALKQAVFLTALNWSESFRALTLDCVGWICTLRISKAIAVLFCLLSSTTLNDYFSCCLNCLTYLMSDSGGFGTHGLLYSVAVFAFA